MTTTYATHLDMSSNTETNVSTHKACRNLLAEMRWLLGEFENLVSSRFCYRITEKRKRSWWKGALDLLVHQRRSRDEISLVLSWLFDQHGGVLPFKAFWDGKEARQKITNLCQIAYHWEEIVVAMQIEDRPSKAFAGLGFIERNTRR